MSKLVVLSTPLQHQHFVQKGFDPKQFEVWCDDERHYAYFENQKIAFKKLDENLIAEHWEKINTWSCETAARWAAWCRDRKVFDDINWAMVICIIHGYLLTPILRSHHFSKLLLKQSHYSQIVLFADSTQKDYPQFSGNHYLNRFLEIECQKRNFSVSTIHLDEKRKSGNWQPETRSYFKTAVLPTIKKIMNKIYAFYNKVPSTTDVLAFGSLRHLSSTIAELKRREVKVALYDFEFHLEQFFFSLKQHIPYLLPECFPNRAYIDENQYAKQIGNQFNKAFELSTNTDLFEYDGVNLESFVQSQLFGRMSAYFLKSAEQINHLKNITSVAKIKSVLVDDDFSVKGGVLAGYFTTHQVPVFCISHANFAVSANVPEQNRHFFQSYTFVNSKFEKSNYMRRGWKPDHIIVTGTPRYDRLISNVKNEAREIPDKRSKILFCGTGLWSFSPDVYSYVGHQKECFGQVQIPVLESVFSAIKGQPIELIIKPHSFEMIPLWKKLIERSGVENQITLKKHSDDIFELLMECDAMILAYWSTTIIESAIAQKPTLYVDFRKVKSPLLYDYAAKGFCHIVDSKILLKSAIQKICSRDSKFFKQLISDETKQYYLGLRDGKKTERVVEAIITKKNF